MKKDTLIEEQVKKTLSNIECDTLGREDRVFLTHVLEHLSIVAYAKAWGDIRNDSITLACEVDNMLGSTEQLIADGLIQD